MNRRNRSRAVAVAWTEVREDEIRGRDAAVAQRSCSLAAGAQWTPQIVSLVSSWLEPVYEAAPGIALAMTADIRRGKRREKKIHGVAVSPGAAMTPQAVTTTRDTRPDYHFVPGPFFARALTK